MPLLQHSKVGQELGQEQAINDRFTILFEDALANLESGLHKKRCLKKYDKVLEKIGRLKQQYSKAAKHYNIKVSKDEKSGNAIKIDWNVKLITIQKLSETLKQNHRKEK